ncbi:hypothetical protein K435DRAFT_861272 [Dendrothele bispora CBS 962.96]|uniref:Uncharacterized protein n=1 Tax=Dendrothele bispora (strain CBS 962.96) TaxID=1314807 RepID=A0A4S8LVM5_DENBC|nr:hypothetical protein K435DRAFT_861272 [Dendrothele bispora CBS 962.96]
MSANSFQNTSVFLNTSWNRGPLDEFTEALGKYHDEDAINPDAERKLVRRIDRLMIPCHIFTCPMCARPILPRRPPVHHMLTLSIYISNSEYRQYVIVPVEVSTTS